MVKLRRETDLVTLWDVDLIAADQESTRVAIVIPPKIGNVQPDQLFADLDTCAVPPASGARAPSRRGFGTRVGVALEDDAPLARLLGQPKLLHLLAHLVLVTAKEACGHCNRPAVGEFVVRSLISISDQGSPEL